AVGAEIQTDRKDAVADRDCVQRLRRTNLRPTAQAVEEPKLQIIISIRRRAAIRQAALVDETARLCEDCARAGEQTKRHEQCANKMPSRGFPSPFGRGPG